MDKTSKDKPILTLPLNSEADVILARRRARQVALVVGFESRDQTRIATAVSEVARIAFTYGQNGRVQFLINDSLPQYLRILVSDSGQRNTAKTDGEPDLVQIGMANATRLMDKLSVSKQTTSTVVQMDRFLHRQKPFTNSEIAEMVTALMKLAHQTPWDEIHSQNQELITALDELAQKQSELNRLNIELESKNKELMQYNDQFNEMNKLLELRVTERTKQLEETNSELRTARDEAVFANELKSQFVANISHEIRTPMSGILGLTEILSLDDFKSDSSQLIRHIHSSAKNLMTVVDDLLDFSKLQAGHFQIHDKDFYLSSLFDEVIQAVRSAATSKKLTIIDEIDGNCRMLLHGDPHHLRRILLNLLDNAVKFTTNGDIKISARCDVVKDGNCLVHFEVIDTGIGISADKLKKIFQPFVQADGSVTRKYGGIGLGLSISQALVEKLDGTIGCRAEEGIGSTFWFSIPLAIAKAEASLESKI